MGFDSEEGSIKTELNVKLSLFCLVCIFLILWRSLLGYTAHGITQLSNFTLLHARHCARCWELKNESQGPLPQETHVLDE